MALFKNPFKQRFQLWMQSHNPPTSDNIALRNRRLYILPTRFGLMYSFLLFVIFLAAINYSNSLAFSLSFLLTAIGIVSLWQTHKNLLNINIRMLQPKAVFSGELLELKFELSHNHAFIHHAIGIQYQQTAPVYISIKPQQKQVVSLMLNTDKRGLYKLDGITIFSRFPTGLFHCWGWLRFTHTVTVYPKPIDAPITAHTQQASEEGFIHSTTIDGDDFAGLREYKKGESLKHISWKAFAQGRGKLSKTFQAHTQATLWLDFQRIQANSIEEKLSKLTSQVLKAYKQGLTFGLKLPTETIQQNSGAIHKEQCLHALSHYNVKTGAVFYANSSPF